MEYYPSLPGIHGFMALLGCGVCDICGSTNRLRWADCLDSGVGEFVSYPANGNLRHAKSSLSGQLHTKLYKHFLSKLSLKRYMCLEPSLLQCYKKCFCTHR